MEGSNAPGVLYPVVPKVDLDFGFLGAAATYERIFKEQVWTLGFHQATLLVRLHAKNAAAGSQVDVILRQTDPSGEDGQDFVVASPQDFLTTSVTSGTAVPSLLKSPIGLSPGPCLRVLVRGTGSSSVNDTYTISADLLLRRAPDLAVEVSRHCYNATTFTLQYVPVNTLNESTTITTLGVAWVAPADGELVEVLIMGSAVGGSTIIGLHTNANATAIETVTVNLSATNTAVAARFTRARFNKGDRLHISVDPTTTPSDVNLVCRWRYSKI